jgi:hypothetical protein
MELSRACRGHRAAAAMVGRRELLRAGGLGLFGLGLPQLLQARDQQPAPRAGKARSCILLFMWGGPAQQDTWDPKPDSPAEYRGEFTTIATRTPGVRVCEHLPRLARHTEKLVLLRAMTHPDVDHTTATHYLLTGRGVPRRGAPRAEDWPAYGAVLNWLGRGRGPLPPFVTMMPAVPGGAPRFVEESHGQDAGWLGPVHHPMRIDADPSKRDYCVGEIRLRADVPESRGGDRRRLLGDLDRQRRGLERRLDVAAMDAHYERAFSLLASRGTADAFDLTREPLAVRERYGLNTHGQAVLQARRLVEAGVPLVTVFWQNDGITDVSVYWDTVPCAWSSRTPPSRLMTARRRTHVLPRPRPGVCFLIDARFSNEHSTLTPRRTRSARKAWGSTRRHGSSGSRSITSWFS